MLFSLRIFVAYFFEMLKNRLPFIITNENTIKVTEDNHLGYSCHCDDIGKYIFEYPSEFHQGKTYPKIITIENLDVFDIDPDHPENGILKLGCSIHAGFNTEQHQVDQCIGFVSHFNRQSEWKLSRHNKYALIWFKGVGKDSARIDPDRFVISGYFKY